MDAAHGAAARALEFALLTAARSGEVLGMVWKGLFAGFLATLMTAAIVGAMPSEASPTCIE